MNEGLSRMEKERKGRAEGGGGELGREKVKEQYSQTGTNAKHSNNYKHTIFSVCFKLSQHPARSEQ